MDVSIIIPVYNSEDYLIPCIESVLQQTNISFEIILVDDGSKDTSPSICDAYANKYDNVKTFHIQNSGPATARNKGFQNAKGTYVTFTDSDDKMEPSMLQKMITAAKDNDADVVCCNYKQVDENDQVTLLSYSNEQYIMNHEEALIHFFAKDKIYSQCWTKLYRRQMLLDNNIRNEQIRFDEDIIYNIRVFCAAKKTVVIDEPLYVYTYRTDSYARGFPQKHISQYLDDRIKRLQITQDAVKAESALVKEWSLVHMLMYCNEVLGKIALFPEFHSDERTAKVFDIIKQNKSILKTHYNLCGFSRIGTMLILYLPQKLYMKYRKSKT